MKPCSSTQETIQTRRERGNFGLIGPHTGMFLTPVGGSRPGGASGTDGGHQVARAKGHAPAETERSQPNLFGLQKGWCPSERDGRLGSQGHVGVASEEHVNDQRDGGDREAGGRGDAGQGPVGHSLRDEVRTHRHSGDDVRAGKNLPQLVERLRWCARSPPIAACHAGRLAFIGLQACVKAAFVFRDGFARQPRNGWMIPGGAPSYSESGSRFEKAMLSKAGQLDGPSVLHG